MFDDKVDEKGFGFVIFDEPWDDYHHMLLHAASQNHRLAKNYRTDLLKRMVHMTIGYVDFEPRVMFGTERYTDKLYRGYSRHYIKVKQNVNPWYGKASESLMNFYRTYPEYSPGDYIFITKNEEGKPLNAYAKAMNHFGYRQLDGIRLLYNTPQHIFINDQSNANFKTEFPPLSG